MTSSAIAWHVAASTLVALVLCFAAHSQLGPASRHSLLFFAIVKFAIPAGALLALGAKLSGQLSQVGLELAPLWTSQFTPPPVSTAPIPQLPVIIFAGWAVGVVIFLADWIRRALNVPDPTTPLSGHYSGLLETVQRRLRVTRKLRLSAIDMCGVAAGYGVFRPMIAISPTLLEKLSI